MARNDDEQYNLSKKVGTVEGRLGVLESTMDSKLFLKLDNRSLTDGAY